eukprot:scaffold53469_cov27-Tisochrysis_lutea.AAC.3
MHWQVLVEPVMLMRGPAEIETGGLLCSHHSATGLFPASDCSCASSTALPLKPMGFAGWPNRSVQRPRLASLHRSAMSQQTGPQPRARTPHPAPAASIGVSKMSGCSFFESASSAQSAWECEFHRSRSSRKPAGVLGGGGGAGGGAGGHGGYAHPQ